MVAGDGRYQARSVRAGRPPLALPRAVPLSRRDPRASLRPFIRPAVRRSRPGWSAAPAEGRRSARRSAGMGGGGGCALRRCGTLGTARRNRFVRRCSAPAPARPPLFIPARRRRVSPRSRVLRCLAARGAAFVRCCCGRGAVRGGRAADKGGAAERCAVLLSPCGPAMAQPGPFSPGSL